MYGGLFGDLPAAKKDKKEGANEPNAAATRQQGSKNESASSSNVSAPPPAVTKAAAAVDVPPSLFPQFVPPQAARKRQQQQKQQPPSRKRALEESNITSARKELQGEGTGGVQDGSKESNDKSELSSNNTVVTVFSRPRRDESKEAPENGMDDNSTSLLVNNNELPAEPQEPEHLRLLHERAREQDPYDPLLPNDLLQNWEHKSLAVEREKLFRQQQASMREQEELRQQLARERQQLEQAGDHDKLVKHRLQQQPSMMGRGRGVSNLPAWLVEKQKKEAQQQQQHQG